MARPAMVDELLRVLEQTEKLVLIHLGDNVLNYPSFFCHCCGCCCVALGGYKNFGDSLTHPSNSILSLDTDSCTSCGICADSCNIEAIEMIVTDSGEELPDIQQKCLGCGVCTSSCPSGALL